MKNFDNKFLNIRNKNILFLQGPMGFYFKKMQTNFKESNKVFRIGFNKGDEFYSLKNGFYPFKGNKDEWINFFANFLEKYSIDIVFLYGDCRFYHKEAIVHCKKIKVLVYVFEEGYIRPDFITLEKYGVNKNSNLPRDRSFYDNLKIENIKIDVENISYKNSFFYMALQSAIYYLVSSLFKNQYPNYLHHRNFSTRNELFIGFVNFGRWITYKFKERNLKKKYSLNFRKRYYFVCLQTINDAQIKFHSEFNSIEEFIVFVLTSFSIYAPKDKYLVIKHHPMDRGRKDYFIFISDIAIKLGINSRVHIVYDVHLPTLLKNAISTVTINSTVGLSSLYHKTPVICLGHAIYDIDGLTPKDIKLDVFWNMNFKIDILLLNKFRLFLIKHTQINDSFYK